MIEQVDGIQEVRGQSLSGVGEEDDCKIWEGRLPASGKYLLVVGASRGNAEYKLRLRIE